MKFCVKCGKELVDEAVVCTNCGCAVGAEEKETVNKKPSGLSTAAKVFMVLGTVINSLLLYVIPLAWCLPMTIIYFKKINKGEPVGVGFKICTLLFVNTIAGILMLCDSNK